MRSTSAASRMLRIVVASEVLTLFVAVTTNIATGVLPEWLRPYLGLAWPLLGILFVACVVLVVALHRAGSEGAAGPITPERAEFSRRSMLDAVHQVWIEGVLTRSLYRRTIIELGMDHRPDLLRNPWDLLVATPDQDEPRPLPPGTPVADVVSRHRGLLVLGAPGAGKTTVLLDLLEHLLAVARNDPAAPIPVMFQLSTWGRSHRPIAEWLVAELSGPLYGVPRDIAEHWVAEERVLPLMDGLDEVALDRRMDCARAIEVFHAEHRLLPLVVSSRIADYDTLGMRFTLGAALLVQPLTRVQVEEYLDRLGAPLVGVRAALAADPTLWELLQTPFLLSVAVRAYEGLPAHELDATGSLDERRAQMLNAFVHRTVQAKPGLRSYQEHDTVRWLACVARSLGQRFETVFHLEFVGIGWLAPVRRRMIIVGASLPVALLVGGSVGLLMWLLVGHWQGVATGVLGALLYGVPLFLADSMAVPHHSERRWRNQLADILGMWSLVAAICLVGGLVAGLAGAVVGAVVSLLPDVSLFSAAWKGGLTGALAAILLTLPIPAVVQPSDTERTGLGDRRVGADLRDTAWLGSALLVIFGGPTAVVLGTSYGPVGAVAGVLIGLTASYLYSGRPLIGYWLARLLLSRAGVVPLKQITFLDFAVSRMLMHKVGGGYLFMHRLLLEHFSQLTVEGLAEHQGLVRLPVVDLRPEAVLARALANAQSAPEDPEDLEDPEYPDSVLRMLTYVGTFLAPTQFAPITMQIVQTMRANLPAFPSTPSVGIPLELREHRFAARVERVADIYWLVVNAGHRELSPQAALELGELMSGYAVEIGMLDRHSRMARFQVRWAEQAQQAFSAAARSGHPTYGPSAAQRLL